MVQFRSSLLLAACVAAVASACAPDDAPAQAPIPAGAPAPIAAPVSAPGPVAAPAEAPPATATTGELPEGVEVIEERYADGKPKLRREVRRDENGIVNEGRFQRWFDNGVVQEEGTYVAGQKDGRYVLRHENGNLADEATYRLGKLEGPRTEYTEFGKPRRLRSYKDDRFDGLCRNWPYKDDQLGAEWTCADGKKEGTWTRWNQKGVKIEEGLYGNDLRQGLWHTWWDDGTPKTDQEYVDEKPHGKLVEYSEKGRKITEAIFAAGLLDGLRIEWFPGGAKKSEMLYVAGRPSGACSTWFESGGKQSEGTLRDGKREGHWSYWNEDGTVNAGWTGTYRDDARTGD